MDEEVKQKYTDILSQHTEYVTQAALKLGVPEDQIAEHDASKWSPEEFEAYANWFYSEEDETEEEAAAFDKAWLHHIHNNPHHWQHWIMPVKSEIEGPDMDNGCLEMPENYILEMIADWQGSNRTYQGHWDMSDWLRANFYKIQLHSKSEAFLVNKLHELGYDWI